MSIESVAICLHHSKAAKTDKLVLLGIANHDGDGGAWPSVGTLARYANCSERHVQRSIARLVELGELVVVKQAGGTDQTRPDRRPNLYRVVVACPADCDGTKQHRTRGDADVIPQRERGDISDMNGVTPVSPEPSLRTKAKEDEGAAAPVSRDTSEVIETGRTESVQTAASKSTVEGSERSITDSSYAARLLDELGDAAPDLDAERMADNYLALFGAARKAGKDADKVAMGLALGLLVRTFGPLPAQARGMLARLVKANGPTAVMHAAVTTAGSSIGADAKYAHDPMGPVRYLSGVVRGKR
jgi:hypothetical protein